MPPPLAPLLVGYVVVAVVFLVGLVRARALARIGVPAANAAPPSLAAPARVVFLGDVQRGIRDVAGPLADVVRDEGAVLVVSSGDLASHGEAAYHGLVGAALRRAALDVPLLVAPGNHDLERSGSEDGVAGRARFERLVGPRRFTARIGPLLLVGTEDAIEPAEEEAWTFVERAVAAHDGPWLLVTHRPPLRMHVPGTPPAPRCAPLFAWLARRPPVAVVSGHLSRDAETEVDGVRYIVNAEGGDVDGRRWFAPPTFHLRVAEVGADGTVSWRRRVVPRRVSWATTLDQLLVRAWASGRRWPARLFAAPGRALLRALRGAPVDP